MDNQLASLVARHILHGADAMYNRFLDVTAGAIERFERQDWAAVQQAAKSRIYYYDHHANLVVQQLQSMLTRRCATQEFLLTVQTAYSGLLDQYPRHDIAESFFNSVYCRLFTHHHFKRNRLFIYANAAAHQDYSTPFLKQYAVNNDLANAIEQLLNDTPFSLAWHNKKQDIQNITAALHKNRINSTTQPISIEMVRQPFFRNKAAYLIGKITFAQHIVPLALPILSNEKKNLYVDACITDADTISVIFGFARSYFMVYAPIPAVLVAFLRQLMPFKPLSHIYTAIGCQKHGKTELYREFIHHLSQSTDKFVIAPGIKGMVMSVFTLPSYDYVFKIIKDKFAHQKTITPAQVEQKYRLVKEHDRVGRMADTLDYRNFVFPKERFSQALLDELIQVAPSKIRITNKEVHIRHLYMERRMTPLNIYLEQANEDERYQAIDEYGKAIKELAAANIFAGDMVLKNFGVSRHQRVIFYDYDEICYLTDIHFRAIPQPRSFEDEMAAEPWYHINEHDVFPEEFRTFLFSDPKLKAIFEQLHADIFDVAYWQSLQQNINNSVFNSVFPYPQKYRFNRRKNSQD